VRFAIGKEIFDAMRHDEIVYVPEEVQKARSIIIQFEAGDDKFSFGTFGGPGYLEGDEVKEDFVVTVTSHPDLGCSRYVLTRIPTVRKGSEKLANRYNFIVNNKCAKAKP